jgi:RNA-directed DNA polymerase
MKRINNVYDKIVSFDNLLRAYNKCLKGKRNKEKILAFGFNYEHHLKHIQSLLKSNKYTHDKYFFFWKQDSKKRRIASASFKDKIVHYAIHLIIEPMIDKRFIWDSYACRKDKGTFRAIKKLQKIIFFNKDMYCLQCDIKKYFKSIDHDVLKKILNKHIKDKRLVNLFYIIIDSYNLKTKKGIPIGNLTSQLFANIYLNELDQYVKHELKCEYYLRYMDDFVILGNKEFLKRCSFLINDFLKNSLLLQIPFKKNQLFKGDQVVFLGFVLNGKWMKIKRKSRLEMLKKCKKNKNIKSKASYIGYVNFSNSYCLKDKILKILG